MFFSGLAKAANLENSFSNTTVLKSNQGTYLREELDKITTQTGISFTIRFDISKEKLVQSVSAENWNDAIKNVLIGYNWVAIQDGAVLKSIIITGKNGNSTALSAGSAGEIHEDATVIAYRNATAANDFDTWQNYKLTHSE